MRKKELSVRISSTTRNLGVCERKIIKRQSEISMTGTSTLITTPSPTEIPDNISFPSHDDELLYKSPRVTITFFHALLATILCIPMGALAMKNVYKMKTNLKDGRKTQARRHKSFAYSLSNAALVVGSLFWCMAIILAVIHVVILKKS